MVQVYCNKIYGWIWVVVPSTRGRSGEDTFDSLLFIDSDGTVSRNNSWLGVFNKEWYRLA